MDWLFFVILGIYFIHASIDCACVLVTLFYKPPLVADDEVEQSQPEENTAILSDSYSEKYKGIYLNIRNVLYNLYPSIFNDISLRQEPEILKRLMIYWISSMSLIRLIAVYWPCTQTILCVSVMYLLEALVAEFEGFTFKSIIPSQAKLVSVFSFGMSAVSILAIIFMSK